MMDNLKQILKTNLLFSIVLKICLVFSKIWKICLVYSSKVWEIYLFFSEIRENTRYILSSILFCQFHVKFMPKGLSKLQTLGFPLSKADTGPTHQSPVFSSISNFQCRRSCSGLLAGKTTMTRSCKQN